MSVAPGVRVFTLVLVIAGALLSRPALAYDTYSENGDATNCGSCHGDFRSSPYRSLVDGQSWGDDLHDVHRNTMLDGDCETCHGSNKFPVLIGSSSGGSGLSAFSCSGCHGRSQDGTGSGTQGFGAGLRQRHWRAGTQLCVNCHSDANPANKVVARENVLPPYYANPGTNHPGIPANPCNPAPSYPENFAATTRGLDNDGDGSYDGADPDCMTAVCGNGALETGEQCDDGNTAAGDCCSAACRFEASGSTCNDGLYCTVNETCNGTGSCGSGQARSCGDAFACTSDSCNETTDACVHAPSNALCDDGLYCNGAETCDAAAGCRPGTTVNCADTNICTDDNCNEATNLCDHVLDPTNDPSCVIAVCGNGVREGAEVCDGDDLAGRTCQSEGFAGGTLGCLSGCSGVDTSSCTSDPNTVLVRIAAGSDDAEESAAGSVSLTSSDLELVYDGSDQVVGLRFTGLAIPRGARIVDAWVRFTAAGTQSEVTQITIQGEAVDNPPTFASSSNDVSARTRTSASVSWAPPAWVAVGDAGADQRTPNLAPILQEIVNRPGWTSGNPLVLLFSGSGQRTAQAYEGSTGLAPLLRVQLGVPPSTVNGLRRTDTR